MTTSAGYLKEEKMPKSKELTRKKACNGIRDILISNLITRYTKELNRTLDTIDKLETGELDAGFLIELIELYEKYGFIKNNA